MGRKPSNRNAGRTEPPETTSTTTTPEDAPRSASPVPSEDGEPQPAAFVKRGDPATPAKRRVSFPVTEDNKVDWNTLRDKGKAELTEVLKSDPEIAKLLGKDAFSEEFPFEFTEKDARDALGFLNSVNSFSTRFFFGRFKNFPIDEDVCARAFTLKAEDEETLAKRGAKLANKYSGEWLRRHADLVMFLALYFKCVTQQTITAVTLQAMKNQAAQDRAQARPNGHPAQPAQVQP